MSEEGAATSTPEPTKPPEKKDDKFPTTWIGLIAVVVPVLGGIVVALINKPEKPPLSATIVQSATPVSTPASTPVPTPPTPDIATAETEYFEIAPEGAPSGSPDRVIVPDGHPEDFHPLPSSVRSTFGSKITSVDFQPEISLPRSPPTSEVIGYFGYVDAVIDPPNRVGIKGALFPYAPAIPNYRYSRAFRARIRVTYEK